ncbi:MAG: hypothetical protein ABI480_01445 [Chitinophagaceae bacterium]
MKTKPYNLLLHPAFLLSLALLLFNDFYFKSAFHNTITGKLSDIAGLFAFAVFLSVFFYAHKKTVLILIASFFIWWKSPLSDPLISLLNNQFHLPVYRVVDYTDLLALVVLPFTFLLKPISYSPSLVRKIAIGCICFISFTAFTATSMLRKVADDNRVSLDKYVKTKKSEPEIIAKMKNDGLDPQPMPGIYEKYSQRRFYSKIKNADGSERMVPMDSLNKGGIYEKIGYGTAYNIPVVYVNGDSIQNLQFLISNFNDHKKEIRLHSFQYRDTSSAEFSIRSYGIWREFRRPLKKKFKKLLK